MDSFLNNVGLIAIFTVIAYIIKKVFDFQPSKPPKRKRPNTQHPIGM